VDSPTNKTMTLGRALAWNVVLPFVGIYPHFTGTPLWIVLTSSAITFVALNLYFLFAFNVWEVKSTEADGSELESGGTSRSLKRRLSLVFWAVGCGGAVLWMCFWIFGFIYAIIHAPRYAFVSLLLTALGGVLVKEAIRTFREERNVR